MRTDAAEWELEGPRMTGPTTSLKMLGGRLVGMVLEDEPSFGHPEAAGRTRTAVRPGERCPTAAAAELARRLSAGAERLRRERTVDARHDGSVSPESVTNETGVRAFRGDGIPLVEVQRPRADLHIDAQEPSSPVAPNSSGPPTRAIRCRLLLRRAGLGLGRVAAPRSE